VRTISGLGFKTLVIDSKSASPYLRRAIRVSMGNIVFLNVLRVDNLEKFLNDCEFPIYATANNKESIDLREWQPETKSGFIIGSEGHGIDPQIYKLCKNTIRIPIREEVEHLNAGHSCAIVASRYLLNSSK
jgi:tRNA G18 (ribose-2'-O)-methylase SpoU